MLVLWPVEPRAKSDYKPLASFLSSSEPGRIPVNKIKCVVLPFLSRAVLYLTADPSGREVYGVSLRPLACWDFEFETRRGHGCLYL